ncbi:hypothetical protein B4113_1981 [Geobacillus sp. B4113_201601]|nr:hypothetical protein B4113_1981 [Geobacillus sp. B4113_201601]
MPFPSIVLQIENFVASVLLCPRLLIDQGKWRFSTSLLEGW